MAELNQFLDHGTTVTLACCVFLTWPQIGQGIDRTGDSVETKCLRSQRFQSNPSGTGIAYEGNTPW
jgi:hypothetical protein